MGATPNPHDGDLTLRPLAGGADVLPLAPSGNGHGSADSPTARLIAPTIGDKCVTCGSPLASDQRYCVSCGERRGRPRFSTASMAVPAAEAPPPPPSEPHRPRASSGGTLIAGIGTLLLALGVGVLIGHGSSTTSPKGSTQVLSIPSAGTGAAAGATAGTAGTTRSGGSKHKGAKSKSKSNANTPPPAIQQKAAAAASKVLGGNTKLAPATVKVGQSGSGAGFNKKTHKFDGTFFGQ